MKNVLFRYSDPEKNHFLSEFKNQQIHFSTPEQFNDPFDCQMEYERTVNEVLSQKRVANRASTDILSKQLKKKLTNIGICCFCRAKKNQLMWSHYANSHKGICIGFNRNVLLSALPNVSVEDVIYQSKHPLHSIPDCMKLNSGNLLEAVITPLLTTKYSYWRYERETRLISQEFGLKDISAQSIQSVSFGLKTSEQDKAKVYDMLSLPQWKHVLIFQAKKAEHRFALEFSRIDKRKGFACL
ncbi:hypothetical protein N475_09990 [Pseudoalteromonas luteoviolacea DSM 6061]|uniref:DUF2971 domain-containing protein n=1 Tax=Pseudoalteromonas luteoviolacea DSM 6061 TaxID=1365250 RepID=A0A166YI13_9GAMM|nr:hypothetical protein N475_09990 [Pseudoalteromonas luteoviolacea DSM 6061]MBE0385154.1 hypothetical protein [Pseudoalteromonas luteoviolacea DSM 6061]